MTKYTSVSQQDDDGVEMRPMGASAVAVPATVVPMSQGVDQYGNPVQFVHAVAQSQTPQQSQPQLYPQQHVVAIPSAQQVPQQYTVQNEFAKQPEIPDLDLNGTNNPNVNVNVTVTPAQPQPVYTVGVPDPNGPAQVQAHAQIHGMGYGHTEADHQGDVLLQRIDQLAPPEINFGKLMKEGWHLFKRHPWGTLGMFGISSGIQWMVSFVLSMLLFGTMSHMSEQDMMAVSDNPMFIIMFMQIPMVLVQGPFEASIFMSAFNVFRTNQGIQSRDAFLGFKHFSRLAKFKLLTVLIGSFFYRFQLVIIVWAFATMFVVPLLTEYENMRVFRAIRISSKIAFSQFCSMLGFQIFRVGVALVGILACVVGIVPSMAVALLMGPFLYREVIGVHGDLNYTFIPPPPGVVTSV